MPFIDVILPLPLPRSFTYFVPDELSGLIQKGVRVIVPFGARKFYSAIVQDIHERNNTSYAAKEIVSVLDKHPVVNDLQIRFWQWIASYYMCTVGEVMKAAMPSGLKLESETKVFYNDAYVQCDELNKHEEEVLNIVHHKKNLPVGDIAAVYKRKDLMRTVQSLVDKEALWVEQVIAGRYKPRFEMCVRLGAEMDSETKLKTAFEVLEKAPKQLEILMNFVRLSGVFSGRPHRDPTKKELLAPPCPPEWEESRISGKEQGGGLNSLVRKKILELYPKEVSRLNSQFSILNSHVSPADSLGADSIGVYHKGRGIAARNYIQRKNRNLYSSDGRTNSSRQASVVPFTRNSAHGTNH